MKIIVCIKAVPGFIMNPKVSETQNRIDYEAGSIIVNESDDYALEEGIKLAKMSGGEVTAITAGPLSSQKALQTALGKDADKAVRVDTNQVEPASIAQLLAAAIGQRDFDLILTGVESRDMMAAQVGVSIAERLGLPFEYAITEIKRGEEEGALKVIKEMGFGLKQVVEIQLPALLCIQTGTVPPRFVPVRKMMMAQSKPVETVATADLNLDQASLKTASWEVIDIFSPKQMSTAEMIIGEPSEVATVLMRKIKETM